MRCKACNKLLTESELARLSDSTGEVEDLCTSCLYVAYNPEEAEAVGSNGQYVTWDELEDRLESDE